MPNLKQYIEESISSRKNTITLTPKDIKDINSAEDLEKFLDILGYSKVRDISTDKMIDKFKSENVYCNKKYADWTIYRIHQRNNDYVYTIGAEAEHMMYWGSIIHYNAQTVIRMSCEDILKDLIEKW